MSQQKPRKRRKKVNPWKNFGEGTQIYDVVFEVDKMDFIRLTEGKDSSNYESQHKKTVDLINKYNTEHKGCLPLSISSCRSIIQGPRYDEDVTFKSAMRKQLENSEVK